MNFNLRAFLFPGSDHKRSNQGKKKAPISRGTGPQNWLKIVKKKIEKCQIVQICSVTSG